MFAQYWVAAFGLALLDVVGAQVAGQMAGADDLDTVTENQNPDGGAVEVVPVHQGVDQQFFYGFGRDFQLAQGVEASAILHVVQVAFDKGKAALELFAQGAVDVFTVLVLGIANEVLP